MLDQLTDYEGIEWTDSQRSLIDAPPDHQIFLKGPAGTGKTTAGLGRMIRLIETGLSPRELLVLVPQRTLASPYRDAMRHLAASLDAPIHIATVAGLARRMIDLFWPLVAEDAGFGDPDQRPLFLTLETAQYYMARVASPLIEERGYFESVRIERNRLYSQILDNLNKSAVVGFAPSEIAARLKGAWVGEQAQARVYDHAQICAQHFRAYCLRHNLLDFSLQMSVFVNHVWQASLCRDHLLETYPHLIVDNVEEDTPVAHDILAEWLSEAHSALIIYDAGAGYRSFLGADPESARKLETLCDASHTLTRSVVMSPEVKALGGSLANSLKPHSVGGELDMKDGVFDWHDRADAASIDITSVLRFENQRYHPQMLTWVATQVDHLIHDQGVDPGQIVILAPFLTDALRFTLARELEDRDIPVRSHRPSRALREEPATRTLLTFAALGHPDWHIVPSRYDVSYAFQHAIADLDLIRARLLAETVYRPQDQEPRVLSFEGLGPEMQQRITYALGERFETLRAWLQAYVSHEPSALDYFLARLFGEILSQPGFGFHDDLDAGRIAATLVESVRKFRWISRDLPEDMPLGQEYLTMVRDGVIAAQYLAPWKDRDENAVLLAPAYTFLLSNQPVDVQFWLNVGGSGWWERLYQPLTHPVVLSRRWAEGHLWTDAEEYALRQHTMGRLVLGLIRRCRQAVYLGLSELGEQGFEQEGALLQAIQRVLRRA
jgi:hypothetical protein